MAVLAEDHVVEVLRGGDEGVGGPVFVVLGWWGAELRHVKKYAAFFLEKEPRFAGAVAAVTPWAPILRLDVEGCRSFARSVQDHVLGSFHDGEGPWEREVVLLAMSNGGCVPYLAWQLECAAEEGRKGLAPVGLVFDSTPGIIGAWEASIAISEPVRNPAGRLCVRACAYAACGMVYCGAKTGFIPDLVADYTRTLASHPSRAPELYLHSPTDPLCPPEPVHAIAEARKANGVDVTEILFPPAPHVQLLRRHQALYTEAVHAFLEKTLRKPKKTTTK